MMIDTTLPAAQMQKRQTARVVAKVSSRLMCITATYFLIQALMIMHASSITG